MADVHAEEGAVTGDDDPFHRAASSLGLHIVKNTQSHAFRAHSNGNEIPIYAYSISPSWTNNTTEAPPGAGSYNVGNSPPTTPPPGTPPAPSGPITPNDPFFLRQYFLKFIGADLAWNFTVGDSVPIAVLDTGIDDRHPDLLGKIRQGYNWWYGNTDTCDIVGHGTFVAGIIGAIANNGLGVTGLAWKNPIIPIRISDELGRSTSIHIAAAFLTAAQMGAKVANCSFGPLQGDTIIEKAAMLARTQYNMLFIAAAGNSGKVDPTPASRYQTYIGGTDATGQLASFSTRGSSLCVVAPAVGIISTFPGGPYYKGDGTSYSAPQATAVAALILAANPKLLTSQRIFDVRNPNDTPGSPGHSDVISLITSTAVFPPGSPRVVPDPGYGYGILNAAAAVHAAAATAGNNGSPVILVNQPTEQGFVRGRASAIVATGSTGTARMQATVEGDSLGQQTGSQLNISWNTTNYDEGPHALKVQGFNAAGQSGSTKVTVIVDNTEPRVSIVGPTGDYPVGTSLVAAATVSDRTSGFGSMAVYVDNKLIGTATTSATLVFSSTGMSKGRHTLKFDVSDRAGNHTIETDRFNLN